MATYGEFFKSEGLCTISDLRDISCTKSNALRARLGPRSQVIFDFFLDAAKNVKFSNEERLPGHTVQALVRSKDLAGPETMLSDVWELTIPLENERPLLVEEQDTEEDTEEEKLIIQCMQKLYSEHQLEGLRTYGVYLSPNVVYLNLEDTVSDEQFEQYVVLIRDRCGGLKGLTWCAQHDWALLLTIQRISVVSV